MQSVSADFGSLTRESRQINQGSGNEHHGRRQRQEGLLKVQGEVKVTALRRDNGSEVIVGRV